MGLLYRLWAHISEVTLSPMGVVSPFLIARAVRREDQAKEPGVPSKDVQKARSFRDEHAAIASS
jgi:hypothetical protein